MIRALFKLVVVVIVIVAAGMFFLGWNLGDRTVEVDDTGRAVGTAGQTAAGETRDAAADTRAAAERGAERGREVGAEVGERVGQATQTAGRAIADGSLTAKIKSKMALDDTIRARDLDVDTAAGVVTVKGYVRSTAERDRALQLARETEGVIRVVDQLQVR